MSVRYREPVKMYAELAGSGPNKTCRICKRELPKSNFHANGFRRKDGTSGLRTDCKDCSTEVHRKYFDDSKEKVNARRRAAYQENKIPAIRWNLKRYYGIEIEDYERMLVEQNSCCKICGKHNSEFSKRLNVDHDHETGKVRGLLCIKCNRGIGLLQDSPVILQRALEYLLNSKK